MKKLLWHSQSESEKFQAKKTIQAYQEISRLCSCLDLSDGVRDQLLFLYDHIRNTIQKSSLGQQIPVIIPVILGRVLKSRGSKIRLDEIYQYMGCNSEQFRKVLINTYHDRAFTPKPVCQ